MITHKLTEEELALIEILENPVWNAEFLRKEVDPDWELTWYQKQILADCNTNVCFVAARAVGKTETLIDKIVYFSINDFFPTKTIAVATPNRVHMEPIWRKLNRWLSSHPFLRLLRGSTNSQIFKIFLKNGITVDFRIAGVSNLGSSVVGLHTPVLFVDEAGFYPWPVWIELVPTVNTWEKGSQVFVCGTPSGERENNVLYFADVESDQYSNHKVIAFDNPRYDEESDKRNQEQYGGKDSDDYQRLVLGEHAAPISAIFSKVTLPTKPFEIFTATVTREMLEKDPNKIIRLLRSLPEESNEVAAGIDFGYTDPTIISLFRKKSGIWEVFARITLLHIEYPDQVSFVNKLDDFYSFVLLAVDEGHAGIYVSQELLKISSKNYKDILVSVNFGSSLVIGVDLDDNEVKQNVRNIAVEYLRRLFDNKLLYLSSRDAKLLSELERVVSTRTPSGNTVYRVRTIGGSLRGEDHIFASMICFSYALYLRNEQSKKQEKRVKLFVSRWAKG